MQQLCRLIRLRWSRVAAECHVISRDGGTGKRVCRPLRTPGRMPGTQIVCFSIKTRSQFVNHRWKIKKRIPLTHFDRRWLSIGRLQENSNLNGLLIKNSRMIFSVIFAERRFLARVLAGRTGLRGRRTSHFDRVFTFESVIREIVRASHFHCSFFVPTTGSPRDPHLHHVRIRDSDYHEKFSFREFTPRVVFFLYCVLRSPIARPNFPRCTFFFDINLFARHT